MLYSLNGIISHIDTNFLVIECGGVGYQVFAAKDTIQLSKIGAKLKIYTYMHVRENVIELYGFETLPAYSCFKLLTSISGVGPKLALGTLSDLGATQLATAIASGDVKTLTKASGVGTKLAGRIILELKDKLGARSAFASQDLVNFDAVSSSGNAAKAVEALTVLGFTPTEAGALVAKFESSLSTEELIRLALKEMRN